MVSFSKPLLCRPWETESAVAVRQCGGPVDESSASFQCLLAQLTCEWLLGGRR